MTEPKLSEEGERLVSELERLAVLADNGSLYNQGTREARLADARAALRAHMAAQEALVENLLADVCYWKGMYNTAEANRK